MQAIFTKIIIGFLLLTLVITAGLSFLVTTANLNGIVPDDILLNTNIGNKSAIARDLVYNVNDEQAGSGIDSDATDFAQLNDQVKVANEQLRISNIVNSFWSDLTQIIPIEDYIRNIIFAIIAALGTAAIVYIWLGRNV